ncbi:MAG: TonB-dependent receptor [Rubricoccaceae bacterium]|nr:TonB-dependent receptor [Rubricoccaceae bacterium]
MLNRLCLPAVGLALLLGFGAAAHAQSSPAVLAGTVTDAATGAPLPGATVSAPALGRGTATDAHGHYRLDALPQQALEVVVRFVGYTPEVRTVDLDAALATLDVALTPEALELEEVDVEADAALEALTRDVRAVERLEAEELDELRGQTLGETLASLNGVTALTTGPSISKPVVRGLHSDRVVVLNNGIAQEGQQWGGEHAPEIDPFAPNQIEVIKGAAGVEYGVGAIGGVVRLVDRPLPVLPGVGGRVTANAFSNSGQGAGSLLLEGATAAVPGLAWRVRGSFRRAGDGRTPDFVIRNSAFREASGEAVVGYTRGRLGLEARLRRYDTELGIYKGSHFGNARNLQEIIERGGPDPNWDYRFSYEIEAPKQAVTHDVASLLGRYDLGIGHAEVQYGLQRNHRREFDAHRPFNDSLAALGDRPAFDLTLITHTLDARLEHRPLGRLFGAVGVSLMQQGNENGASGYLIPNFTAWTGGAFARETWLATDRLSLDAGARLDARWMVAYPFDYGTRSFDRRTHQYASVSAALGALYRLDEAWSVAANAGTAWRPPGVNELYAFGVHHGSARFERGDDALTPERSLDLSATLRHESAVASGEVNVYANRVADYVYLLEAPEPTVTIRGTFPTFDYVQDDALLQGLDAQVELRPLHHLDLGLSASLLRADNLDLDGPLYGMPSDRFGARARLHADGLGPFRLPYLEAQVQHVTQQDRLQPGAYEPAPIPDAYTLTDLRVGAEVDLRGQPIRLALGVQNLFDVRYRDYLSRFRYFIDEPGRNVVLRVSLPFGRLSN